MNKKILAASVAVVALTAGAAFAASQNFVANIAFATPLTLTKISDLDFGTVRAGQAGSYTLSTAGTVTTVGGEIIGGTPQAGELTIAGSLTQTININTSGLTPNSGVTPSAPTCAYDGGVEAPCTLTNQAAPGAGKTLLVGLTLDADGTQADGTLATPNFNVDVVYN